MAEPDAPRPGPVLLEATVRESAVSSTADDADLQVGRYQLRGLVGRGGMGVVVAAYDPELHRSVAIKLVSTDTEEARARLVREAQAMARLSHPNVVTVYEVMRVGERAGIVMELVDGQDLALWQKNGPPSWREIVAVYAQAARGLAAAHGVGLVHRDFKPSNALLGKDGVVRVTDFGLAARTSDLVRPAPADPRDSGPNDVSLTLTGAIMGTPAYMAPEQHLGAAVDARTDQWALACSLYEALYGQRPFAGETPKEIRDAVVQGAMRPEPGEPKLPRWLRAAMRRALASRPADRFATMDELIAALRDRARRAWQIAALLGVLASAGVAAAAISARGSAAATCRGLETPLVTKWNASRAATVRSRFAASRLSYAAIAAERVIAGLDSYGARWVGARTRACTEARQGVESNELLDRRMHCLDQRLAELDGVVDGLVEADATTISHADEALERLLLPSECDDPREAVPRPAGVQARNDIAMAEALLARAWASKELGQFEKALPLARQAADLAERTGWSPLLARALVLRGETENRKGAYAPAAATFDHAATVAAQAKDDIMLIEALAGHFFVVGEGLGRPSEAFAGRKFIELQLARAGQPPRSRAIWLHNLAVLLLGQEKLDDALAAEVEAVAAWRKLVPSGHPYLLDSLETEGNIETFRSQFDRAEALLGEVLSAHIASLGPEHPLVANTLGNLGVLEGQRKNMPAAIDYWMRALAVRRAAHAETWMDSYNLGLAEYEIGRWRAAGKELAVALPEAEQQAPGLSRPVALVTTALGADLLAVGQLDRAQVLIEHGIEAARVAGTLTDVDPLSYASRLAIIRGDLTAAHKWLSDATKQAGSRTALVRVMEAELARAEVGCRGALSAYELALASATKGDELSARGTAVTGLGECQVELGAPAAAVATLEPHVKWLAEMHADAAAGAPAQLALARAMVASGGDRRRARALAESARAGFSDSRREAEVARFLATLTR